MAQQFANQAQSVLSQPYTAGDVAIYLANASAFPATGNFTLAMGNPVQFYLVCTARSYNTLTVISTGQEGTVTTNLASGTPVTQVITAGVIAGLVSDITTLVVPAGGVAGQVLVKNSSTNYDVSFQNPPSPFGITYNVPTLSMFTLGSSNATVVDTPYGIKITGANNTGCSYLRPTGLTTPWNIEVGWNYALGSENYCHCDLYMRTGSDGACENLSIQWQTSSIYLVAQTFNSNGVYQANVLNKSIPMSIAGQIFFKVRDDGVNRTFYYSGDGVVWVNAFSEARGTTYAVDRGGFNCGGSANFNPAFCLFHYKEYNG